MLNISLPNEGSELFYGPLEVRPANSHGSQCKRFAKQLLCSSRYHFPGVQSLPKFCFLITRKGQADLVVAIAVICRRKLGS